mmetsp:Transcript_30815/g.57780  ORF Transcript_30815/g.57780 Transcript_30815/m.57780 type:complete len:227 (-) Transcript_30815:159-839(-)
MDALRDRVRPNTYAMMMGLLDRCCVAPVAKWWTCPPRHIVRWEPSVDAYPSAPTVSAASVVFAGSFNPPHHGHFEIIRYLCKSFETVHVVIGINPSKTYPVSPEQRKTIIEQAVMSMGARNVKVWVWGDVIYKLAKVLGATAMYRGIRSWQDDGKAERYLEVQNLCWPVLSTCAQPMGTYFVEGPPQHSHVSSTLLRERLKAGMSIDDIVPAAIAERVRAAYAGKL